ncbi:hypothetical protein PoB_003172100 [Plakobranchus ocellatus]|uniref:Uncharacterized protein n=1 Tax=Plakobranchus ocellatus TaxID=259542 RepID=A0AAV4A1X1_9GAST|nr:hypothetical protein PoB_003172100 [Plakobranchus ocellatus]
MRRGKLEHLVTTGKFEGKRSRGRQREKIMDGLATWLGPGKVSDYKYVSRMIDGQLNLNSDLAMLLQRAASDLEASGLPAKKVKRLTGNRIVPSR